MSKKKRTVKNVEACGDKKLQSSLEIAENKTSPPLGESSNNQSPIVNNQSAAQSREKYIELEKLLDTEPALTEKLIEALKCGRWMITVHFQKKYKPEDEHDLHHTQFNLGYPMRDAVASLKCISSAITAEYNPTGELEDDGQWH